MRKIFCKVYPCTIYLRNQLTYFDLTVGVEGDIDSESGMITDLGGLDRRVKLLIKKINGKKNFSIEETLQFFYKELSKKFCIGKLQLENSNYDFLFK